MFRCFSTLGCPELSLDEVFALARRAAIPAVELRALSGTVELPALFQKTLGSPVALAAAVKVSGVGVQALDTSFKLVGHKLEDRAKLLEFIPWAEAAGARWLRVFDGGKEASAAEIASAAETLAWWADERRKAGAAVDLMIETHDSLVTASAILALVAAAPAARVLWDAHHTWYKGGEDAEETWARVRGSVVHVHVKDSVPVASARHPYTYVLPGDGRFPMAPLLARLEADGYGQALSLEWERMWHPYLPPLEEALALAASRRWW
jgi:sugar phosphate isomerase/epimerase